MRILLPVVSFVFTASLCWGVESAWVKTGVTGRLIYVPDAEGDRVLDFSSAGYQGRGLEQLPPEIPSVITLSPIVGDDTGQIQAAINQLSLQPIQANGYRGAILLSAGTYEIDSQLDIRASGIVLRGEGSGTGQTVIHGRNPQVGGTNPNQRPLIHVYGNGTRTNVGSTHNMIDKVVPAGANSFRLDSTSGLAVGDTIRIERPSTQEWIDAIGMNNPPDGDPPWQPGTMNIRYDRVITRIEGQRIFLDAPLSNSFELQYGGGTVREYSWPGLIENVGIENLRGDSDFDSSTDEDHAWEFISIGDSQNANRAQNVWVRDVVGEHFGDSLVVANPGSKWVTVTNASSVSPVSQISGERRYTYDLSGELGLVANSSADQGRHDFVNNSTRPAGPNVFYNSSSTNANNDSGPHQRWATGTLFDNISVAGDNIDVRNRGSLGTSHGWSGANMVIWNSQADAFIVQNPPTAQNWLVGSTGTIVEDTTFGAQPSGYYDAHGTPVVTGGRTSLYEAQMEDSRDISVFHAQPGLANWNDSDAWDNALVPLDSYQVSLRDYLVGDIDGLVNDGSGSVDQAYIDPAWQAAIAGSSALPITAFDDQAGNQNVAFTIETTLDEGEIVIHGFLALALRQTEANNSNPDFIRLFDFSPEHVYGFDTLGWDAQLTQDENFVGVLDLGPHLSKLQSGQVNLQISDDAAADWAMYTVAVATPRSQASLTEVFIDSGSTIYLDSLASPVGQLRVGGTGQGELQLSAAGQLTVIEDFSLSSQGTLTVEIAGTEVGLFGSLAIGAVTSLDGRLEVTLGELFQPVAGQSFSFLESALIEGEFSSLQLPALSEELAWNLRYEQSSVSLEVLYSADFNADHTVDAQDLDIWQTNFGTSSASHFQGDANGDGLVNGRDFLFWQQQLGLSENPSSLVQIPESGAAFSALVFLLQMISCRHRPRH